LVAGEILCREQEAMAPCQLDQCIIIAAGPGLAAQRLVMLNGPKEILQCFTAHLVHPAAGTSLVPARCGRPLKNPWQQNCQGFD